MVIPTQYTIWNSGHVGISNNGIIVARKQWNGGIAFRLAFILIYRVTGDLFILSSRNWERERGALFKFIYVALFDFLSVSGPYINSVPSVSQAK